MAITAFVPPAAESLLLQAMDIPADSEAVGDEQEASEDAVFLMENPTLEPGPDDEDDIEGLDHLDPGALPPDKRFKIDHNAMKTNLEKASQDVIVASTRDEYDR